MALLTKDLYWAAGFLEGEGTFTGSYQKRSSTGMTRRSATFSVNAGQNEAEPLERLHRLFGGNLYYNTNNGKGELKLHRWYLNGTRGIALMMTLWPLMTKRRKRQIEVCIARFKLNLSRSEAAKVRWAMGGFHRN
jgi:hypothetical protein